MISTRLLFLNVMLLAAVLASGCGRGKSKDIVLASVGADKISMSDFNERIASLPERYRDIVNKRKMMYLQELINDTLLYREAVKRGLQKDRDVLKVIEEAKKKILIARLLKDEVDDVIEITEDDTEKFYNENKSRYMTPEVMRVSHILVPTREEGEAILEELAAGSKFEDLARAKSMDPTAQRGGDIGYFPKGQLMPEFEEACSKLAIGQISDVVKTSLGYHLIKLTDRKAPELRPMKQVMDDINSRLRVIKRQEIFNGLLKELKEKETIEVNEEALEEVK